MLDLFRPLLLLITLFTSFLTFSHQLHSTQKKIIWCEEHMRRLHTAFASHRSLIISFCNIIKSIMFLHSSSFLWPSHGTPICKCFCAGITCLRNRFLSAQKFTIFTPLSFSAGIPKFRGAPSLTLSPILAFRLLSTTSLYPFSTSFTAYPNPFQNYK